MRSANPGRCPNAGFGAHSAPYGCRAGGIRRTPDRQLHLENEWRSFRTRKTRELELISAPHTYTRASRYTVAVKVIDFFGNDTMTLVPVNVG